MTLHSPSAAALNESLKAAMAALFHLADHGAEVLGLQAVPGRNPIITIQSPSSPFLQGHVRSRMTLNGFHRCVMVTVVHGCQVEWLEIYPVAREACN